jgi:hypothetical protein
LVHGGDVVGDDCGCRSRLGPAADHGGERGGAALGVAPVGHVFEGAAGGVEGVARERQGACGGGDGGGGGGGDGCFEVKLSGDDRGRGVVDAAAVLGDVLGERVSEEMVDGTLFEKVHDGPYEAGELFVCVPVVDNSRLVPYMYTPQSVAASLAAVKRAEHAALNQSQNSLEHAQKIPNPHRFRESQPACGSAHTHTQGATGRTRPTHKGDSSASHNTPSSVVMFDHTDHIKSYHPMHVFLPPASPWIMQAVPSYTDTWAGLIRSCEVHAVNPYR